MLTTYFEKLAILRQKPLLKFQTGLDLDSGRPKKPTSQNGAGSCAGCGIDVEIAGTVEVFLRRPTTKATSRLMSCCGCIVCPSCLHNHRPAGSITLTCAACFGQSIALSSLSLSSSSSFLSLSDNMSSDEAVPHLACCQMDQIAENDGDANFDDSSSHRQDGLQNLNPVLKAKWLDLQKCRRQVDRQADEVSKGSLEEQAKLEQSIDRIRSLMELRRQALLQHYETALSKKLQNLRCKADRIAQAQLEIINAAAKNNNIDSCSVFDNLCSNLAALSRDVDSAGVVVPVFCNLDEQLVQSALDNFGRVSVPVQATVHIQESSGVDNSGVCCCVNKRKKIHFSLRDADGCTIAPGSSQNVDVCVLNCFDKKCPDVVKLSVDCASVELCLPTEGIYTLHFDLNSSGALRNSAVKVKCVGQLEYKPCATFDQYGHEKQMTSVAALAPGTTDDFVASVGCKGFGLGQFHNPQAVCCTQDGRHIVVTDSNNQCVQIFDASSLECVLKFGSKGRQSGQLTRPTGVTPLDPHRLLVADYDNKWVGIYKTDGSYCGRFAGSCNLLGPKGLLLDGDGHAIVVDNRSSSVFVFDVAQKFKLIRKFGVRGDRQDQFAGPHYAALGDHKQLLITDFHHHCVKIFDCSGRYISSFGSPGQGNGQFNAPTGIATDGQQHVFVADWGNNRVQIFDLKAGSSFLGLVSSTSSSLYGPQGIFVDRQDQLLVADSGNHCVKIFKTSLA